MARKKQIRINEVVNLQNVFISENSLKGRWREDFFKNDNPIILELGCGWGHYCLELGEKFPNKNFIGIDKKGERLWQGAQNALANNLNNVAFIRTLMKEIDQFFEKEEVDEIWLTFPDPFPKPSKHKKRLSSQFFLEKYHKILKENSVIHLKTDDDNLFKYSLEIAKKHKILNSIEDIYSLKEIPENLKIKTFYEKKFLKVGKSIKYLSFSLQND